MPLLDKIRQRCRQPEVMDQPDLDRGRHFQALRGLERISLNCRYPHLRRLDVAKSLRTATMFKNRLSNIRIVIVDDHADTRNLLRLFLEHCGAQPAVASNGQEALELIKKRCPPSNSSFGGSAPVTVRSSVMTRWNELRTAATLKRNEAAPIT